MKSAVFGLAMALAVAFGSSGAAFAGEIRVGGGGAAISAVFFPIHNTYENETGELLTPIISTPVQGLVDLSKGMVDVATAAHSLDEILRRATAQGIKLDPADFTTRVIATNRTLIFVNKINMVQELDKEQLKGIFTGKITNWKAVGGKDLPIEVVWGKNTPGQNALFTKAILDGEKVTEKATAATDYSDIRDIVMKRPGAIGIGPFGFRSGSLNNPRAPEISAPIIAITKGEPSPSVKKLYDFIAATVSALEQE